MDFSKFLQIAIQKKKAILIYAFLTAGCVFFIGLFLLKYEANATLIIKPLSFKSENIAIKSMLGMVSSSGLNILNNRGNSYINILESRELVGKVIARLGLEKAYMPSGKFNTRIIGALKQPLRFLFYGRLPSKKNTPSEIALKRLKRSIKASFLVNSSIISLSIKDSDAERSAAIANTLLDVFIEYSRTHNIKAALLTKQFIESQLELTRERLKTQRNILGELKKEYNIFIFTDFENEVSKIMEKLNRMEDQYEENEFNLDILKKKLGRIKKEIDNYPEYKQTSYAIDSNKTLLNLKNELLNYKIEIIKLLYDYKPEAHQVLTVKEQMVLIEKEITSELDRIMEKQQFQVNPFYKALMQEIFSIEENIAAIPILNKKIAKLIHEYRDRLTEFESVKTEVSEIENSIVKFKNTESKLIDDLSAAELLKYRGLEEAKILDRAIVPRYPMVRHVPLAIYVVIGFIAGLIFSTGWVVLKDQLSDRKS